MTDNSLRTDLFSPTKLGSIELQNRIVMAPLTRSRVDDNGVPGDLQVNYYRQRASAGLLITEATNISPQARGYAFTPGIWNDQQIEGWKKVTTAVHEVGGKIVCQLWHVGRISHTYLQPGGAAPVAPSAIQAEGLTFSKEGPVEYSMPRALETSEIPGIVEQYAHAAKCAKLAGFDGVEIHSANGYLLDQFIRDSTNLRTDQYGGSIENRTRIVIDTAKAVANVWGADKVGIRLSPVANQVGSIPLDSNVMGTYGYLIKELSKIKLAYLHFVEGIMASGRGCPEEIDLDELRNLFDGPYVGNNTYDLELAMKRRAEGKIDAVAFGRPFIANPDLVERLKRGAPLAEAPRETFYGGGEKGYTDWPTYNFEDQ